MPTSACSEIPPILTHGVTTRQTWEGEETTLHERESIVFQRQTDGVWLAITSTCHPTRHRQSPRRSVCGSTPNGAGASIRERPPREGVTSRTASPPIQPVSGTIVPRYAGPGRSSDCRAPRRRPMRRRVARGPVRLRRELSAGRPVRPRAIRQASRLSGPFHPITRWSRSRSYRPPTPATSRATRSTSARRSRRSRRGADELLEQPDARQHGRRPHRASFRSCGRCTQHGPVALVHFDAHLDTWDTYFGAPYTHGTLLRRAAEEGLFRDAPRCTSGSEGRCTPREDLVDDAAGLPHDPHRGRPPRGGRRGGRADPRARRRPPALLSIDIDVLDPAHAPGTGRPRSEG